MFSFKIVHFWPDGLKCGYERYKTGKTNTMLMVLFTPVVLKESSFTLPVFHMRLFLFFNMVFVCVIEMLRNTFKAHLFLLYMNQIC